MPARNVTISPSAKYLRSGFKDASSESGYTNEGAENLVDRKNPEAICHPAAHTDDAQYILDTLAEYPRFLRTPIVRCGEQVTLGVDEAAWEAWIKKGG